MLGQAPGLFWRVCWVAISPAFLAVRDKDKNVLSYSFTSNLTGKCKFLQQSHASSIEDKICSDKKWMKAFCRIKWFLDLQTLNKLSCRLNSSLLKGLPQNFFHTKANVSLHFISSYLYLSLFFFASIFLLAHFMWFIYTLKNDIYSAWQKYFYPLHLSTFLHDISTNFKGIYVIDQHIVGHSWCGV